MGSFKFKLVMYFVLLALLPLAAAFWGFDALARRSETNRVDARLEAGLRAALNVYGARVTVAARVAARAGSDQALQRALRGGDAGAIAARTRALRNPNLVVTTQDGVTIGSVAAPAAFESVSVLDGGQKLGTVSVGVRLDNALLASLRAGTGLDSGDMLVFLDGDRVLRGPSRLLGERVTAPAGRPGDARVGGNSYRLLRADELSSPARTAFAVLAPRDRVDAAVARIERRLTASLLALLLVIGLAAYVLSRSVVGTLSRLADAARTIARGELRERVPVRGRDEFAQLGQAFNEMAAQLEGRLEELASERTRLRESTARIGQALSVTHDIDRLLVVLVETAVEATGASGGVVLGPMGEAARSGEPEAGLQRIELPLTAGRQSFGRLVLTGQRFGSEAHELAASLVGQAVIALENARLHRIVERQASVDGLTGVANRRASETSLHSELARVARFGGDLALVFADLDDFKAINDRYGHPTGDIVLREFADTLRETVRDVDVVGRWGGEEFAVMLPGTDVAGGARVAERARAAFEDRLILAQDGSRLAVTASFGVAASPGHGTGEDLITAADGALYEAKRAGKNRVVTATTPLSPAR